MRLFRRLSILCFVALVSLPGVALAVDPVAGAQGAERAPRLAATIRLGGSASEALLGDTDGDGTAEAVYLRGGHVFVTRVDGSTVFDRFVGATDLVAVADLDGDRAAEVVFTNRTTRALAVLNVRAGIVRWRHLFPPSVAIDPAYVRVADVNSSIPGSEIVVFPDHSNTLGNARGYFFSATGDLYANPVVKSVNGNQLNYPQMAIGNVDGKGDPEIVVVGRPKLLVFGSDGDLESELDFRAGDPEGRHYGTLTLAEMDGDASLEAVVVADRIPDVTPDKSAAITVFDLDSKIREKWRVVVPHGHTLEAIPHGVADFDGDALADVAVNHYDGTTQIVEVYRGAGATSGKREPQLLCSVRDAFAWDARDADSDARPSLFASIGRRARPTLSFDSTLAVLEPQGEQESCRLERKGPMIEQARYATRPLQMLGDPPLTSSLSADRVGVVFVELPEGPAFVTYTQEPGGSFGMQVHQVGAAGRRTLDLGTRPGTVRAVADTHLLVAEGARDEPTGELAFYRWNRRREALVHVSSFDAAGFDAPSPAVADLDRDARMEIVVRLPGKRMAAFDYSARGEARKLWEVEATSAPVVDPEGGGEGAPRIYAIAPTDGSRAELVAYDRTGAVVWRRAFKKIPASTKPEVLLGEFTGKAPRDLWVSAGRIQSWLVDGADGSVVWTSDAVTNFDNRSSVRDVNEDGIDDLIVVSNDRFGVYDGRSGRPLVGPKLVTSLGSELFASPVPSTGETLLLVGRGSLARATFEGSRAWSVERGTARTADDQRVGVARNRRGAITRVAGNYGEYGSFVVYDFATGKPVHATDLVPITDVVAADTNRDGTDEFIFGTSDGRLVAIRSDTGTEAWAIDLGGFAGTPVVADLDGGRPEVLVPVGDGTLRVFAF